MLMQKAKGPRFWCQVRQNAEYEELLSLIKGYYHDSRQTPILALSYRARMRFYTDGDRAEFERPYFARRTFLASAALLALIYPEQPQYLEDTQEALWAICEEYSWALPAHTDGTLEEDLTCVDLFCAETGFAVAELCYLLEDRLDKLVLDRARAEVRSRVIENYKNRRFSWETNRANWAAVCAGNVGGALLYLDRSEFEKQLPRLQDTFLPGAQQAILHRKGYSLAVKAGHNHEPHNHNDVGTFILATDRGQIFCDLGAGLYTRQYFRKESRYDIFCNSSFGHSVPILNGQGQRYGDDYRGTIRWEGDRITVDFADSYAEGTIKTLARTFVCGDQGVLLTDRFSPDCAAVRERFVTLHPPVIFGDYVSVGGVALRFDPNVAAPSVSTESHLPHNASLPPETVYCIDFNLPNGTEEVSFRMEVMEETQ